VLVDLGDSMGYALLSEIQPMIPDEQKKRDGPREPLGSAEVQRIITFHCIAVPLLITRLPSLRAR